MTGDDATVSGVARRYATALYELASAQGVVDAVLGDLGRFGAMLDDSADLTRLVRSPAYSPDDQLRAVAAVLKRADIGGLAGNFVKLAAKNGRLFAVGGMIAGFRALVAQARGEVTAMVSVAEPISDARLDDIKASLRDIAGKDVQVDLKVDPALIGGLVVRLGDRMIDTSLRTKLTAMQLAMKEVR